MSNIHHDCPFCGLDGTYPEGNLRHCPDCGHEWAPEGDTVMAPVDMDEPTEALDANGNPLADGDAVILIKDLKVKGASGVLKKGTKIKSIRIVDGADSHNIDCKTDMGSMLLKSAYLKKA
jgi:protein PhnA